MASASLRFIGPVALLACLFKIDVARGYILIAFPLHIAVLLLSLWIWPHWRGMQPARGTFSSRVQLDGSQGSASRIVDELARQPGARRLVVGVREPSGFEGDYLHGTLTPRLGQIGNLHLALNLGAADTVVVTGSEELSPARVRELSWSDLMILWKSMRAVARQERAY